MTTLKSIEKVWIYGNGGFAKEVCKFLKSQGIDIVGSITKLGFEYQGTIGDASLYEENKFPIIIGVFNHKDDPVEILDYLEVLAPPRIISPASFMNMFKGKHFSKYYLATDTNHDLVRTYVNLLEEKLSDEESVKVLRGFVNYREFGDARDLVRSAYADDQYLGKTLPNPFNVEWLKGSLKWFDIGSFDGDTLRAIYSSDRNMADDSFICAEPDNVNFKKLQLTVNQLGVSVQLHQAAIGAKAGTMAFNHEGTLSARPSGSNSNSDTSAVVQVETIDEICNEFVPTHVKMDIEGGELDAIKGGLTTLKTARPKIAVSLYHKPLDIIELCEILMTNLENYSWFIRCYGAHGYDTILYGVPN